jgi:hypothetical protein
MKISIYIPPKALGGDIGGGWSFTDNFIKGLRDEVDFASKIEDCDIYFIPGPTLAEKEEVEKAKVLGKKIVVRVDNIPRNSRNRNTGVSRLLKYCQMADKVVYQSQWAKDWIMPFTKIDGDIIINGVDLNTFKPEGERVRKDGKPQYLYVRSSRDETKNWEGAWYTFQNLFFKNPDAYLWIVGKFSEENLEYNFDLFGGAEKRYRFWGLVDKNELAVIYRSADLLFLPFRCDACSNTLIEALVSNCQVIFEESGANREIYELFNKLGREYFGLTRMCGQYLEIFQKLCPHKGESN